VTVGSGVTTSAKAQTANLNTRTVAVVLASATDVSVTAIAASTEVADVAGFVYSGVEIANPVTEAPSSITYKFALNIPLKLTDSISLLLPKFTFGTLSAPATTCASTSFTATSQNSGTATATITLNAQTNVLEPYQDCVITIATGITTGNVAQAVDFVTATANV
jgi:hypothetical protein